MVAPSITAGCPTPSLACTSWGWTSSSHWPRRRSRVSTGMPATSCGGSAGRPGKRTARGPRSRRRRSAARGAVPLDQLVGGAVVGEFRLALRLQLRGDALRELLAQLDSPLVERTDGPHRGLGENAVLVQRHQLTQHVWRELLDQERGRRVIALEHLEGDESLGRAFCPDLVGGLTERQRLALREHIRGQEIMVLPQRVQRVQERDEIHRNRQGALMLS